MERLTDLSQFPTRLNSDAIAPLKHFINVEYDTQILQLRELWEKPITDRVAEGEAISDLEIVEVSWNKIILRCRENLSKFRPGDYLRLHKSNPTNKEVYRCILESDRGIELIVSPGYGAHFFNVSPSSGWILDRDSVDVREILLNALDVLEYECDRKSYILGILGGNIQPNIDRDRYHHAIELVAELGLNPSQREAFCHAYATHNYSLIQGPPGTGKTWLLAHLAAALAREGQRVLITAFTHRAINNALRKIAQVTDCDRILKVGQGHYAADLTWEGGEVLNFEKFSQSPYSPYGDRLIVGGTCFAVRTNRLKAVEFDTVIFDEAGQVTLPLAISGMLSAQRYIFIGDRQQMAPVIVGEHPQPWMTRSVFETLFDRYTGIMLNITYRMNAEINRFPSQRFYDDRLQPSEDAKHRRLKLHRQPKRYAELLDPDRPNIFVAVRHVNRTLRSPEEAELAAGIAAEAVACGVSPHEIAIVAPYRAQGRLIRQHLQELEGDLSAIVVDTVERIQGQERDLIIISLTTSDRAHAAERAAFYFQPNRLNVAITRPRVKRIAIGSPVLLTATPEEPKHREWIEHFRLLYQDSEIFEMAE